MAFSVIQIPGYIHSTGLLAFLWCGFAFAFLFVIARTAIRLRQAGSLAVEDGWIFVAITTLLVNSVLQTIQMPEIYYIVAVQNEVIASSPDLTAHGDAFLRYEFAIIGLYWTVLWSVKASFLAVYFKLFAHLPLYRRLWYLLVAFTFLSYVGCWVASFMTCRPLVKWFSFGQCDTSQEDWNAGFVVYFSTICDIVTDALIMALPVRLILSINISYKQKIGLVVVFGLCFFMIVFAIIRAEQILSADDNVNIVLLGLWSGIESSISVIVGCLPPFKQFFTRAATTQDDYCHETSRSASHEAPVIPDLRLSGLPFRPLAFVARADQDDSQPGELQEKMVDSPRDITAKNEVVNTAYNRSRALKEDPRHVYDENPM